MVDNYEFQVITVTYCGDVHCTNIFKKCVALLKLGLSLHNAHVVHRCTLEQALGRVSHPMILDTVPVHRMIQSMLLVL